jgi:hypothetical protein
MKVQVYSIYFFNWKKIKSPSSMKDFNLPSVGARFKKWGCCTVHPFSQNARPISNFLITPKNQYKKTPKL